MGRKLLALTLWIATLSVPMCGLAYAENPTAVVSGVKSSLDTRAIDASTAASLLVYLAIGLWIVLIVNVVSEVVRSFRHGVQLPNPRITGVLASAMLLLLTQRHETSVSTHGPQAQERESVPIAAVVSPVIAAAMISDLVARRKATSPVDVASVPTSHQILSIQPDVATRIESQVRPSLLSADVMEGYRVVVRVFGHPVVENTAGDFAFFRKNRSLELLTWLVLNRDRMRRSAARTAMWDGTVSDSSFATVVSDARRGLSELCPGTDPRNWLPPTFSDELPLSPYVVSDHDLLLSAVAKFKGNPTEYMELVVHHLDGVRDLPFAGTTFRWPDLDGTTTRLVMDVLSAVGEVVEYALGRGDGLVAMRALSAGLRMMPGDETLLALQRKLCVAEPKRAQHLLSTVQ